MTDVDLAWARVLRRLQSLAPGPGHNGMMQMKVLLVDGRPVLWTRPSVIMLEPGAVDMRRFLESLSDEPEEPD